MLVRTVVSRQQVRCLFRLVFLIAGRFKAGDLDARLRGERNEYDVVLHTCHAVSAAHEPLTFQGRLRFRPFSDKFTIEV